MSAVAFEPLLHHHVLRQPCPKIYPIKSRKVSPFSLNFTSRAVNFGGNLSICGNSKHVSVIACSATSTLTATSQPTDIVYSETFDLQRIQKVEGKIYVRLNKGKDGGNWQLTVGCTLPGKWILHWGVHYVGDTDSEWDQPPNDMRPPGSVPIKDYAIETPLSSSEGEDGLHEVNIGFNSDSKIAAINFVLKDEETGSWYQNNRRDFVVALVDNLHDGENDVGAKNGSNSSPGCQQFH